MDFILGLTPDISEYAFYAWFDWVWYRDPTAFPDDEIRLGRWLGVVTDEGAAMYYWIAANKYSVVARSTVMPLKDNELRDPKIIERQPVLMKALKEKSKAEPIQRGAIFTTDDDDEIDYQIDEDLYSTQEQIEFTPDSFDEYLTAQVMLPIGGDMVKGEVVHRERDANGQPVGLCNANPLLDTREFCVQVPDGSTASYLANTIAENLYSQVDELLDEVIDHVRKENVISLDDLQNMPFSKHQTTEGWKI